MDKNSKINNKTSFKKSNKLLQYNIKAQNLVNKSKTNYDIKLKQDQ